MKEPQFGEVATAEMVVETADTAAAMVSEDQGELFPAVFATARMVALMETAGAILVAPHLGPGEQSVGVVVEVSHTAATPVGSRVRATARYLGREGKLLVMEVVAEDEGGEIGRGTHKRAIIDVERLVAGARRRNGM